MRETFCLAQSFALTVVTRIGPVFLDIGYLCSTILLLPGAPKKNEVLKSTVFGVVYYVDIPVNVDSLPYVSLPTFYALFFKRYIKKLLVQPFSLSPHGPVGAFRLNTRFVFRLATHVLVPLLVISMSQKCSTAYQNRYFRFPLYVA